MKYIKLIKHTFIGSQLNDDEIHTALHNCSFSITHFNKGEVLHIEGDDCLYLEILLTGSIVNMKIDQNGNELMVNNFEYNDMIGGNILFGSFPKYPFNFIAKTNGSLLQIKKHYLFSLFIKKPDILKQFLTIVSDRAANIVRKVNHVEHKQLRDLIMEYLNSQSNLQNSATIALQISKRELADRFGVQRTSVSREFSRMKKDGLIMIHSDNKTIEILKQLS
ncbi:MAG: Crp/Fnr family transcriptional regulator [Sedimentibacter sp.]|uniref:Crp/Fnr family transcriptional regulator n=1 Tax=Sedimentibacter sp. TaxID=1960295 RepID=UPI003158972E